VATFPVPSVPARPRLGAVAVALLAAVVPAIAVAVLTNPGERASERAGGHEPLGRLPGVVYRSIPADPGVDPGAARAAARAALLDPVVARRLAGARSRPLLFRAYGPDPDLPAGDPCRRVSCVAVTFYDYDADLVLEAVVTARGRVVEVRTSRGQPPLAGLERREAHRLAHASLPRALRREPHAHPGLAKPMWPEAGPCARHRCATVVFLLDDLATTGIGRQVNVVVDLSRRRVVESVRIRCAPACVRGWRSA